jgi:hypothetical protein
MANTGFLSFADPKLEQKFNAKPYDPSKDRARALAELDKAESQFASTERVKGKAVARVNGDVVKFTSRFNYGGQASHFIPSDQFRTAIKQLRSEINTGKHDDLFKSGGGSGTRRSSGGGWTDERRARYQATMAAKKRTK